MDIVYIMKTEARYVVLLGWQKPLVPVRTGHPLDFFSTIPSPTGTSTI
ncbi:MAG: hypothetical protein HQ483_03565 [Rhodospirillales bacterium]|nr:hypothetical protein [Rhodospirillales bacterium]